MAVEERTLAAAADNKAVEGADANHGNFVTDHRRTNNTQIFTKAFQDIV